MPSDANHPIAWTTDTVADKILAIVASKTTGRVTPEATFVSLGLDSLAMAEMVFEIETAFKIRTNDRLLDVRTIGEVIDYVLREIHSGKSKR